MLLYIFSGAILAFVSLWQVFLRQFASFNSWWWWPVYWRHGIHFVCRPLCDFHFHSHCRCHCRCCCWPNPHPFRPRLAAPKKLVAALWPVQLQLHLRLHHFPLASFAWSSSAAGVQLHVETVVVAAAAAFAFHAAAVKVHKCFVLLFIKNFFSTLSSRVGVLVIF